MDFGSKTVGVAISDPLLITAQGIEIIRRKDENKLRQTLARIEELIVEYEVSKIVLGFPKNMNDTLGERAALSLEFQDKLERRTGLPVVMWDERLTTVAADKAKRESAGNTVKNMWIRLRRYLFCRGIWTILPAKRSVRRSSKVVLPMEGTPREPGERSHGGYRGKDYVYA